MKEKLIAFIESHKVISLIVFSFLFAFIVIMVSSQITSFLFPRFSLAQYYNDSSIFYVMGKSMAEGRTPYIEIYDHKGLYIFYYTAISGVLGRTGLFFFQVLIMSVNFAFLILAMREFKARYLTILWALMLFGGLYCAFGQAPADADLEMPFMAIMIYFYARGFVRESDNDFMIGNIFAGIVAGIALNLRMTDAMVALAFVIYYALRCLRQRKWKILLRDALLCIGGLLLMCLPPFIHAFAGGFFKQMADAAFLANFRYVGKVNKYDMLPVSLMAIFGFTIATILLLIFKRKTIKIEYMAFVIITLAIIFLIQIVIVNFPHYLIVTFDYFVVIIPLLASLYIPVKEKDVPRKVTTGILSLAFIVACGTNFLVCFNHYEEERRTTDYILSSINENDKDGHIICIDVTPAYYLQLGAKIGYPDFACQGNHMPIASDFSRDKFLVYLASEECHFVIAEKNNEMVQKCLEDSLANYEEVIKEGYDKIPISLYRHII